MTIIEFYDKEMLENIIATLVYHPERMVLFGKNSKKMNAFRLRAEKILRKKNIKTEISVVTVNVSDYFAVCDMLRSLTKTYPDCIFDLTGGEETVLVAMGAVSNEQNVPMRSINPRSCRAKTVFPKNSADTAKLCASLSIDDAISLFGGTLTESFGVPQGKLREDVMTLWDICRKNCGSWNTAVEYLTSFMQTDHPAFDGVSIRIPDERLLSGVLAGSRKAQSLRALLDEICRIGIAEVNTFPGEKQYRFQSPALFNFFTKSGNVLEHYTLATVASLKDESGLPLVESSAGGAVIDWDPIPDDRHEDDVKNEIDVLATRNAMPIFISCKNGCVDSDELYKLSTVAERFGGKYAKKILVMTYFNVPDSFVQRAHAMNIHLIRNVQDLSTDEFAKRLETVIK